MNRRYEPTELTRRKFLSMAGCAVAVASGCTPENGRTTSQSSSATVFPPPPHKPHAVDLDLSLRTQAALNYLTAEMDLWSDGTVVYDDVDSGAAAFFPSNRMGDLVGLSLDLACVEAASDKNHSVGLTCMKVTYTPTLRAEAHWAGVYWTYPDRPNGNWGQEPGRSLVGATKLQGWIRGSRGKEVVELKIGGINRPPHNDPSIPFEDDFGPAGVQKVLANTWEMFEIPIPQGAALDSVIGGFACVVTAASNPAGCTFYLDDLRYDDVRPNHLRLIRSFTPTANGNDRFIRNAAHLYDNVLALLVFLSLGDHWASRAQILADSIVWAQLNDRAYHDGQWRNAYSCGPLVDVASGTARLPGWYDTTKTQWLEDSYAVSVHTGNVAWAMIGMLAAHSAFVAGYNDSPYLRAALRAGRWIDNNCRCDGQHSGYSGGFSGWEANPNNLAGPAKIEWSSTEHNLDLYVAFSQLGAVTGDSAWRERALHAQRFVLGMWNPRDGHFWTGTFRDAINKSVVPEDAQTWPILALGHDEAFRHTIGWEPGSSSIPACLRWVDKYCAAKGSNVSYGSGFRFSREGRGLWFEGTAHVAAAFRYVGDENRAAGIIGEIARSNPVDPVRDGAATGGIYAAYPDVAETGFDWTYPRRLHLGATAWFILASLGINPYWVTGPPRAPGAT